MVDYNNLAVYDVNKYLWQKLQDADIIDKNKYYIDEFANFVTPIIPAQQIPEFNNLLPGKPYIIYDYETKTVPEHWWITDEVITYTVLSQDYDQINKILNFLMDNFRRYDDSAKDLNVYTASASSPFNYHFMYVDRMVSPEYFKNEGGFMLGQVDICIQYTRNLDSSGRFA